MAVKKDVDFHAAEETDVQLSAVALNCIKWPSQEAGLLALQWVFSMGHPNLRPSYNSNIQDTHTCLDFHIRTHRA